MDDCCLERKQPKQVKLEAERASANKKVTQLSVLGRASDGGCGSSEGTDVRAWGEEYKFSDEFGRGKFQTRTKY